MHSFAKVFIPCTIAHCTICRDITSQLLHELILEEGPYVGLSHIAQRTSQLLHEAIVEEAPYMVIPVVLSHVSQKTSQILRKLIVEVPGMTSQKRLSHVCQVV